MKVSCVVNAQAELGEGPLWDPRQGRLYWFDIQRSRLLWFSPETHGNGEWALPHRASAAAVRDAGDLLIATEAGLGLFDTKTGQFALKAPATDPVTRSNEGGVDRQGRFWWGTMRDGGVANAGAVYRLDPDWTVEEVLRPITIPNALAFSPDGATVYLADSAEGVLWAFDVDVEKGSLGQRRLFAQVDDGSPDGAVVDAEGYVWNAHWGAWRVVRYAPDGRIDRVIDMPVEQPTSCAFGGPDLATLYITSAREGLSPEALERQPLAGGLFAIEPGVRGLPLARFRG